MIRLAATLVTLFWAGAAAAEGARITGAEYTQATGRYAHDVLGDIPAWGALRLTLADGTVRRVVLSRMLVFEDIAPRLADLDGDGRPEVVVVETHVDKGAALAVYDAGGRVAATPHIGRRHRWLAPVGAADLDGDGNVEIAFVDRPHLARRLDVWRFENGALDRVATFDGVTNHRIGDETIFGGIRDCGRGAEMIVASANWKSVVAVRLSEGALTARTLAAPADAQTLAAVMDCAR